MAHRPEAGLSLRRAKNLLPLFVVLILVLGIGLHFCLWKTGMFIDEIYSYGLSNSRYMPFIGNGEHDMIDEQLITRDDFYDYLAITDGEPGFDVGSVYYNQVQDVHPPLYYWLLNFCSSLARGHFSKWIGLIPGMLMYAAMLVLLYLLGMELWNDSWTAAVVCALYGLSQVGFSTMLMIRMYVLMTLLTVLLALLLAKELRRPSLKLEFGIAVTVYLGMMTQYYFVFYAFFACLAVGIVLLARREWQSALRFGLAAFVGVGLMLMSFPSVFTQMTGHRLGPESDALANLKNVGDWVRRLRFYFGQVRVGLSSAVAFGIAGLLLAAACSLMVKNPRLKKSDWRFLILVLPVIPTVCVPALISPVLEGRYIYNIMPICVLATGFVLVWCSRHMEVQGICVIGLAIAVMWSLRTVPDYIYEEHRDYTEAVSSHADDPCLYLTGYYAGVTQDMLQLMTFDDVYVTEDPASGGLAEYLEGRDSEELVVYVDVDSTWGSGFNAREMLDALESATGYGDAEELYRYGLSNSFVVRK